jgi:hypothetical protein
MLAHSRRILTAPNWAAYWSTAATGASSHGSADRPGDRTRQAASKTSDIAGRHRRAGALPHARNRELTARKELREHFSGPAVQLAGALK